MKIRLFAVLFVILLPTIITAQSRVNNNFYLHQLPPMEWQEADTLFQQTLPVNDQWWMAFQDPILNSLIEIAVNQNYSILMAMDRIDMAKANLEIQRGTLLPTVVASGGRTKQQSSANISRGIPRTRESYFNLGASMSWEIDIFGRLRQRIRAQEETFEASKEDYLATMVSLCAQVATAYINLREAQEELEVAQKNLSSQERVVNITEVRFKTGLTSKLDVAQAKSVYYSTNASIPVIEAAIIQYINTLGTLLGLYPDNVRELLSQYAPLPDYMEPIGIDIPVNLLRRRPDIREAERQIQVQAALLGASKADILPQFALNGSLGYSAHNLKNLFDAKSFAYEISPTVSITLFQGGQLTNAVRLAKAELNQSINQYNQTVLIAFQEVDNAMNAYRNSIKQIVALREVVYQGQQTLQLSLELYKQGLTTFQDVLDAQRSLLSYENSLVQAKGNSLIYLINMYQSLGGGWY